MLVPTIYRTTKTNITFYRTDGKGRDDYINYNNGGFWKDRTIKIRDVYKPCKKIKIFHSLFHHPPPFNYISDGSGRDSYVLDHNGGLTKTFEPLIEQKLIKFLRKNEEENNKKCKYYFAKPERRYLNKIKRIREGVVTRLYNDSLEKIKINKKFRASTGFITPLTNYQNGSIPLHNKRNENIINDKEKEKYMIIKKNYKKKRIFEKFLSNKTVHKNNSAQNIRVFNINDNNNINKTKILKKIRINSEKTNDNALNGSIKMKYHNNFLDELTKKKCHLLVMPEAVDNPDVKCIELFEEQLYLSVPPAHPLSGYSEISLQDLEGETMLLFHDLGYWSHIHNEMKNTRFILQQELNSLTELIKVSALPAFTSSLIIPHDTTPNRIYIPITDESAKVTFYCCYKKEDAKRFKDLKIYLQNRNQELTL